MHHHIPGRPSILSGRFQTIEDALSNHANRLHNLEVVVNAVEAATASKDDASDGYKFYAPRVELISLAEIAQDVTRTQPLAHVVVEGKDYNSFNYFLLHAALYDKMCFIAKHNMSDLPRYDAAYDNLSGVLLKKLKVVTPTVKSLDVSKSGVTFKEILATLKWVETMPVRTASESPVRVIVRR